MFTERFVAQLKLALGRIHGVGCDYDPSDRDIRDALEYAAQQAAVLQHQETDLLTALHLVRAA